MIVAIEGNIGSGKSTLLNDLEELHNSLKLKDPTIPEAEFFPEPIPDCLEGFYRGTVPKDQLEDEFIELKVNLFLRILENLNPAKIYFIDSSFVSCIAYLRTTQPDDYRIHRLLRLVDQHCKPHHFMFVRSCLGEIMLRIAHRGRPGEELITSNYLYELEKSFDVLFEKLQQFQPKGVKVYWIRNNTHTNENLLGYLYFCLNIELCSITKRILL